jgi:hypothetical protein
MEPEVTHGLYATYTNMKCRCTECKQAAAEYMRGYRKTSTGKSHARLHQIVANKRSQIAVQWIKEQHPDRWANICQEALQSLENNEKGSR